MSSRRSDAIQYLRLTPAQLEQALSVHAGFLNGRRGLPAGFLRYLTAPGAPFDGRRLSDIDLTGAHLAGSSFVGADLRRASLYCADLSGCDLRRARLDRADLRGARLAGSNLGGAILDEADMRAAVLCASSQPGDLRVLGGGAGAANLDDDGAHVVDFSNCSLRGARLRGANLKNANFTDANLDGCDLTGARLGGARFEGAIITGVDIDRLGLPSMVFAGCVTDPSPEAQARIDDIHRELDLGHAWVTTDGKAGRPPRLDELDLRPAAGLFANRLMVGLSARGAVAIGMEFAGAELAGASFDEADLRGADFSGCDLRGASFRNAKLAHARFKGANIEPLTLEDGGLRHTSFEGARLDGTGLVAAEAPDRERRSA